MTMTHSRRTSFDCQLVDAYLVSLQSDIEAKWRDVRSIRDDIHLLMRPGAVSSAADSEAVRTITEATRTLLDHLVIKAPPRDREVEAAKAKARAAERYGAR